jgi:hypothetical protein
MRRVQVDGSFRQKEESGTNFDVQAGSTGFFRGWMPAFFIMTGAPDSVKRTYRALRLPQRRGFEWD